jgi:hypothetical protein
MVWQRLRDFMSSMDRLCHARPEPLLKLITRDEVAKEDGVLEMKTTSEK